MKPKFWNWLDDVIINGQKASSKTYYINDSVINYDAINTVSFYIKGRSQSARDGEYTATFNGKQLFSVTGYNPWFNEEYECKQLVVHSTSGQMPLSNIILADAPFDLRERITAVPLGSPVTDMIDLGDGSYMAESAGQQIHLLHILRPLRPAKSSLCRGCSSPTIFHGKPSDTQGHQKRGAVAPLLHPGQSPRHY